MNAYKNTKLYSTIFGQMRPDFAVVWSLLEVTQPQFLAEFGCGNGRLLPLLLGSTAKTILGLDVEDAMLIEFAAQGGDRVSTLKADLRETVPDLAEANVVILTSSVMKHLLPSDRRVALAALRDSLSSTGILYFDHCSHLYGSTASSPWQNYFDTLKYWWPEEYRTALKHVSWRKEVDGATDLLFYRNDTNGEVEQVNTYVYTVEELKRDIQEVGLTYCEIANRFPAPTNLFGMKRFLGLVCKPEFERTMLERIASDIRQLAFGNECL